MLDETERQHIEQEYSKSWEIAEAVYHDVWIVYMDEPSEAFYALVQEIRAKGYEFWCDCEVETGYLHIMRGESWIKLATKKARLKVKAEIAGKSFQFGLPRIAFDPKLKLLFELLLSQSR